MAKGYRSIFFFKLKILDLSTEQKPPVKLKCDINSWQRIQKEGGQNNDYPSLLLIERMSSAQKVEVGRLKV